MGPKASSPAPVLLQPQMLKVTVTSLAPYKREVRLWY